MNINEKANNDLRVSKEWHDTTSSYWDGRDYKKHMQYQRVKIHRLCVRIKSYIPNLGGTETSLALLKQEKRPALALMPETLIDACDEKR